MFGVSTWEEVRGLNFRFKKIVDCPGVEMDRVFPTQQKLVSEIIKCVKGDSAVEKMLLFGSSINMRCTATSDLDLLIFMKDTSDKEKLRVSEMIQEACGWKADILWADRLNSDEKIFRTAVKGVQII